MSAPADVIRFTGAAPAPVEKRVRPLSLLNYELDRLAEATEALSAAQLDVATAIRHVRLGQLMTDDCAILNGEALQSALTAAVSLARLMGCREQDRAMLLEVERWIAKQELA